MTTMYLRVVIADDEDLGRERLRQLFREEPRTEIVAECATGRDTVAAIRRYAPHVVCLDVRMPELDGFGVLEALGSGPRPEVIFATAHKDFAFRAFEVAAVDYLLKPVSRDRLSAALRRARLRLESEQRRAAGGADVDGAGREPLEHVLVRSPGRLMLVKIADIDWIQAADNYVELHVGNGTHLLRAALGALQARLPPGLFVRISRSRLVNLNRIRELGARSHGDYHVVLHTGLRLTGSRKFRADLAGLFTRRS